jgi:hypothetical protein
MILDFPYDNIHTVSRLVEEGAPDPPAIPLATDRLGIFGAVLFAVLPERSQFPHFSRVQVIVRHGGKWQFDGSGGQQNSNLLSDRDSIAPRGGPYLIPTQSGFHSRDDTGKRWSIRYIGVRATSDVARVLIREGGVERELTPPSHGNLVILFADGDLPAITAFNHDDRQLLDGLDTQPGFEQWLAERRKRQFPW